MTKMQSRLLLRGLIKNTTRMKSRKMVAEEVTEVDIQEEVEEAEEEEANRGEDTMIRRTGT